MPQFEIIAWRDGWPYLFTDTRNYCVSLLTGKMQERNRRRLAKDFSYPKLGRGAMSATNQLRYLTKPPFYPMFQWKSKTQFLFLLYLIFFFPLPISIYFLVIEFQMKNQMNHRRCSQTLTIGTISFFLLFPFNLFYPLIWFLIFIP